MDQDIFDSAIPVAAVVSMNLGRPTFMVSCTIREFLERAITYNPQNIGNEEKNHIQGKVTQRDESVLHRKKLGAFILRSLVMSTIENEYTAKGIDRPEELTEILDTLGETIYGALQPITCNIRHATVKELTDGASRISESIGNGEIRRLNNVVQLYLKPRHLNWSVIDGNHRLEALGHVKRFLEQVQTEYPKKNGLFVPANYQGNPHSESMREFWHKVQNITFYSSSVKVELHVGLDEDQERQLFTHLNLHPKIVAPSLAQEFDKDNPLIQYTKKLGQPNLTEFANIKLSQSQTRVSVDWDDDDGTFLLKDLVTVNAICFLGKTGAASATPKIIREREELVDRMWKAVNTIENFGSINHRAKTVAAQPVVLKGIANLLRELAPLRRRGDDDNLARFFEALEDNRIDFSHHNKVWRALFLSSDEERSKAYGDEISEYVFVSPHTNLVAGEYQENSGWVRFGSRHNDIYKRISDLIRYQLKLPPRDQYKEREKALRLFYERSVGGQEDIEEKLSS